MEELNIHIIEGPNGMCRCGTDANGKVIKCGEIIEDIIRREKQDLVMKIKNFNDDMVIKVDAFREEQMEDWDDFMDLLEENPDLSTPTTSKGDQ